MKAAPGARCLHCLQLIEHKSEDHVFPSSWYPETTPSQVQRWKVPSCKKCNNALGKIEKELLLRLGLCIDPAKAEASGISARVLRSFGLGNAGQTAREKELRRKTMERLLREIVPYYDSRKMYSPLPGLGLHAGFHPAEQLVIPVSSEMLTRVAQKVVRGCEFKLAGRYVEVPYSIRVYFVEKSPELEPLYRQGSETHLGPGFELNRMQSPEGPIPVLYRALIWGTIPFHAAIDEKDFLSRLDRLLHSWVISGRSDCRCWNLLA
jgi:hypothetical protein